MKILIMCEGPNELKIMNLLLQKGCLSFTEDDLVGLTPYHARQINKSKQVQMDLDMCTEEVCVYRVGDKQSDRLVIPPRYKDKIIGVEKYCTKPELEMLLILAENRTKEYEKMKSKLKPKDFAKQNIQFHKMKYDNSTKFYEDYFENRVDLLIQSIRDYKKYNGSHKKDEHYLAELLNDN